MRRLMPVLLLPILVAACGGGAAPPPSGATSRLHVGFPPHGIVDTIVVDAVEPQPLHAAELVAPDGKVTAASYIDVTASPRYATGQWNAANPWPNSLAAENVAPGLIAGNAPAGAAFQSQEQLLATVSTADIPLPDPVAYRRDWQHYRIRLGFGTPPSVETRELAAPQPPPGS